MQLEPISLFFTVAIMQLFALMLPGPDLILTVRNTLSYHRHAGLWTALGLAVGMTSMALISAFLLPLLAQNQAAIIVIIRYLGAAYLAYLGWRALTSPITLLNQAVADPSAVTDISVVKVFVSGVLCNLLNPKSLLFYMSLFSMLLTAEISTTFRLSCVIEMFFAGLLWFSLIAFLLSGKRLQACIHQIENIQKYISYCSTGFFWLFAILLVVL